MSAEARYYEAAAFWADGMVTNAGNSLRIAETISQIPADVRTLLDVGCGNGVFTNRLALARPEIHVTATDRSREALKYVDTQKFTSDMTSIPCPNASFDCVTCLQVIEHLPYDRYQPSLSELARVARRYIVIGVPYKEDLERDFTQCPKCQSRFNLNLHLRSYDDRTILALFESQGFRCVANQNIAKERRLVGVRAYVALRKLLQKGDRHFDSPICPVCGYENSEFKTPSTSEVTERTSSQVGWRTLVKRVWPRYTAAGYWNIALYERR